jgi:hypothetical protein
MEVCVALSECQLSFTELLLLRYMKYKKLTTTTTTGCHYGRMEIPRVPRASPSVAGGEEMHSGKRVFPECLIVYDTRGRPPFPECLTLALGEASLFPECLILALGEGSLPRVVG